MMGRRSRRAGLWILCVLLTVPVLAACDSEAPAQTVLTPAQTAPERGAKSDWKVENSALKITVGETEFLAAWAENASAQAFGELLAQGPLTVEMEDYGGFEKVGDLGVELERSDARITAQPGDVILYQGSQITIYYGTNTWNFTRLASITDPADLQAVLGSGTVTVTFSLV